MLFTSVPFLFYFLPLALILHRLAVSFGRGTEYPNAGRLCIFALTIVFYGFREPFWLVPFFICIGFDFLWVSLLARTSRPKLRTLLLCVSIFQNLTLLGLFKYSEALYRKAFVLFPSVAEWWPHLVQGGEGILLPAGISFYTFESLSFVIDVYSRRIASPKNPLEFFAFIGMFPRFIAGPIVRYKTMAGQFTRYAGMQVESGLYLFALGLFYKCCLADSFAIFTSFAFDRTTPIGFLSAWLGIIAYAMQLYFDFSGYSLMAIGLGVCFGFQFPANFNKPYLAESLQDFWRRWHISLSSWFRDYFFNPLALVSVRRSPWLIYPAILLTMALIGIWHGPRPTYIVMGVWHGLFLCLEHAFPSYRRAPVVLRRLATLAIVMVGWIFFRVQHGMGEAAQILQAALSPASALQDFSLEPMRANPLAALVCLLGLIFCFGYEKRIDYEALAARRSFTWAEGLAATAMVSLALLLAFSAQVVPFLYFQF